MKRLTTMIVMAFIAIAAGAQTPKDVKYVFTEASDLNLIGKIMDTPNPYHRVDTVKYKGFTRLTMAIPFGQNRSENRSSRS